MPDTRPQIIDLQAERQQRAREEAWLQDSLAKWEAGIERRETRRAMAWTAVSLVILAAVIAIAFLVAP